MILDPIMHSPESPAQVWVLNITQITLPFSYFLDLKLKICSKNSCKVFKKLPVPSQKHKNIITVVSHLLEKQDETSKQDSEYPRGPVSRASSILRVGANQARLHNWPPLHTRQIIPELTRHSSRHRTGHESLRHCYVHSYLQTKAKA